MGVVILLPLFFMQKIFEKYLEKHQVDGDVLGTDYNPDLIVVIPCYDEPDIDKTIVSLQKSGREGVAVELIVVVNSSEHTPEAVVRQNEETYLQLKGAAVVSGFRISPLMLKNVRRKHAGVGYARKVGMDLAVWRFCENKNYHGAIVSLDADTLVQSNYFQTLGAYFANDVNAYGAVVRFEHPLIGKNCPSEVYHAITAYELHLRYVNQALKFAGFPYAHHTVGSAFAVRASAYVKHGGMNRRQGGEDFYFLHKLFPHGKFAELNSTCVYPSPRTSQRVPFGTGPQVKVILQNQKMLTYCLAAFTDLKTFFDKREDLMEFRPKFPDSIEAFLQQIDFDQNLEEIRANAATLPTFTKRLLAFFDAFKIVKFLNFAHDTFYQKREVALAAADLLRVLGVKSSMQHRQLLATYRKIEGK